MPTTDTLSSSLTPGGTHEADLAAGQSHQVNFTPAERAQAAQIVHRECLESRTYAGILREEASCVGTARLFVEASLEELAPRDAIERMLAVQMLWQHARLAQLIRQAGGEVRPEILRSLNAAIDAGMNTYRRQAEAWDRIRVGRTTQFRRGGQVNVGETPSRGEPSRHDTSGANGFSKQTRIGSR